MGRDELKSDRFGMEIQGASSSSGFELLPS